MATNLINKKLKHIDSNLQKEISIDIEKIQLVDNNVTVTFSPLGIQSTNAIGLKMDCNLNMSSNNIVNANTISSMSGFNLTLSSSDNTIINSTGLQVNTSDYITMTATNDYMTLSADNEITITSNSRDVKIRGGNGSVNNNISLQTYDGTPNGGIIGNISLYSEGLVDIAAVQGIIQLYSIASNINILAKTGLTMHTNTGDINLTAESGNINFSPSNTGGKTNIAHSLLNTDMDVNGYSLQNVTGINSVSGSLTISETGGNIVLTAPSGFTSIQNLLLSSNMNADSFDINNVSNIQLLTINGMSPTTIGLTWADFNSTNAWNNLPSNTYSLDNGSGLTAILGANDLTFSNTTTNNTSILNTTSLQFNTPSTSPKIEVSGGNFTIDSNNSNLELNSNNSINLTALGNSGGYDIYLNASNGRTAISSGNDIIIACSNTLNINSNNSSVNLNTVDLANSGGVKLNTYHMGITFFNKWNGNFSYNTSNNWEIINPTQSISFPTQFLSGTWAVQFSINCWNVGSGPSDKELAMYFDFLDGANIQYTGFTYRQQTPFANWFNPSQYFNTAQQPLSITYTDYFDFTGAVNNLELRINWHGNQPYSQEFSVSTTFTLMTLI